MKRGQCGVGLEAAVSTIAKAYDCTIEEATDALHEALLDWFAEQPADYVDRIQGILVRLP